MVALVPHQVLLKINKALETDSLEEEDLVYSKEDRDYDLEILIHVGEKGVARLGHVDLWFLQLEIGQVFGCDLAASIDLLTAVQENSRAESI